MLVDEAFDPELMDLDEDNSIPSDDKAIQEPDNPVLEAQQRNKIRIRQADLKNEMSVGKYLPDDIKLFFSVRIAGPSDDVQMS
ncbi:MAG: hypothetical protein AAGJ35_16110, partial [Myxococcota bacterium]